MALYDYGCAGCGPFELRADAASAGAPAPCPGCGALCARVYAAPAMRSPRRSRQLGGVGRAGRERIDRAQQGIPRAGPLPPGPHVHAGGPVVGHAGPSRPWQVGH
jgi:putative FmdB family regulatory protein